MAFGIDDVLGGGMSIINLLGGLFGSQEQGVSNVNPYTEQLMGELSSMISQTQGQQAASQRRADALGEQSTAATRGASQTGAKIAGVSQPRANDWWDQWTQNVPEYQQIALEMADEATKDLGVSLKDQAQLQASEAMQQVAAQYGGSSFSGAAAKAAGQGAAAPIASAQAQLAGTKGQLAGNIFNQLAGGGQSLTSQSTQAQYSNAINALSQQLSGQLGVAGNLAQQGAGYQGAANQQGNIIASLMGQKASFGGPQIQAPTYTESPFGKFAAGAGAAYDIYNAFSNNSAINDLLDKMKGETP